MVMSAALMKKATKSSDITSDPLIEVAKKIAGLVQPETWLIDFLVVISDSIDPRYRSGHAELATADLRTGVSKVSKSASQIIQYLSMPEIRDVILLNGNALSVGFLDLLQTMSMLEDAANQAHAKIKPGKGKGISYAWPNYVKPKVTCALIIREAWRRYGNRPSPGAENPDASEAAELLWVAAGNQARAGEGMLPDWKRDFKEAASLERSATFNPIRSLVQRSADMAQAGKLARTK